MIHYIQNFLFNMFLRRYIIISLFTVINGQSIHNAFGLGLISFNHNAASAAVASRGIIPSFNQNVSLSNPVTWNNFNYAYLSGNYNGDEYSSDLGVNGLSGISSAQFTVPIGDQYAWGFGLKPLFNQQYLIEDDQVEFYVDDDTLLTQRSVDGSGGISSLYTAFRFPLTVHEGMAVELDVLFGSLRKESKFSIDQRTYHYFQRHLFSGSLYKIFFSSDRFSHKNIPLNIYFMYSGAINPLKIKHYSFQPFEDLNENGYYDIADNPSPSSAPSAEINIYNNVLEPYEIGFGFDMLMKNDLHLMLEAHSWNDKGYKDRTIFPLLSQYVNKSQQVSLAIAQFSPETAFKFAHKIQYRGGVYYRKDFLEEMDSYVNEIGISLGIGIKFSAANNQIDFAYRYGFRTSDIISDEKINHFTIGMQLGDLWFVKRRPK
ncbi:MAG: hypothetical protein QF847_04300 [Candidatus Marinimicrobia bacterium]|nr:hypothetical protein [Candidatus Neomarinimicrobiota bacterium]MDP6726452.1 hypothetical protein [Candidatus Neomarinimicrobiota bacterium]|tara:strand:- start:37632 stop:38921 length:1290 start_codon:yes stop_codon:yes gene_type:complete